MNSERKKALIAENFGIALEILRVYRMRSGLIILGVAIGVAALMGMMSLLLGLVQSITENISSSEATVIQVMKFDFMVGGFDQSMLHRKDLTTDDSKAIRAGCPSLSNVCYAVRPMGSFYTLRAGNEKSRMIQVIGAEPALMYIHSLEIETGRLFTDQEVFHRSKVVVLGHGPRRDLFPNTDPIGKKVKIDNDQYTVVGAFAQLKTLFENLGENFAIIPYPTYMASLWNERDIRMILATVREGVSVEAAKDEVIQVMRKRRRLKANQENDFSVITSDAAMEFLSGIMAPIAGILAAIASISLLVGGIGVMNMMLVSVTERTGEIGLRKALGAKYHDILWQFLIEAVTLTGLGGIIGTFVGLAAAAGISRLTGLPSSVSIFYILIAVLFSIGIGLFFGLYPANRAAKLHPVQAMGYAK